DQGTEPLAPPPPNKAPILAAALGTLRDCSKSSVFWVLFATFFICGASTNGLIQVHLIPMCLDFGIPQVQAASLLAAMGVFDFFGTIVSGWLSDRYDNRWLLFWYYGLRGLSLLFLPFTDFSFYGLSLFAMFYGLDWIATVPPTVRLTAQKFGPERANLVFGWIFAGHQLGAATAAFGAGLSRTALQTYLPAFFIAGALCIVGAIGCLDAAFQRQRSPIGRWPGIAQREPARRLIGGAGDAEGVAHNDRAPRYRRLIHRRHGAHAVTDGRRLFGIEPDHEARTI